MFLERLLIYEQTVCFVDIILEPCLDIQNY